jgi:putative RNA 2'-phosphotransferase
MGEPRLVRVSKLMSLILRHEPEKFGVALDGEGWTTLTELLDALRSRLPDITEEDVRAVVGGDTLKRRFSIEGGEIRANYGHSIDGRVSHPRAEPPPRLFHGTAAKAVDDILAGGLRPMSRQYVHLTTDRALALKVGGRRGPPRLIEVDARRAHAAGVPFYQANLVFWLADRVPAAYLSI